MSTEHVWGKPDGERWGIRETAAAVAVAAVIAAFGGAAVYAATDQASTGPGSHQFGPPPGGFGGPGGPGGAPGGPPAPRP
ncbi:hypothetical protein E4P42_15140 [Mycobacterium sp. PS03-16]|uniref:hypothetical protein n=1 Tax=Mycobacterium sp. PS03-16 TaxID=2559611 RepID=UPI001073C9CC|nr:hypothetical protein [Mycobacterium sp. PS03-16]TFV57481.1 hypothetical protein E4P42_15140 [Mycobacterium sp. PS03-16]